MNDIEIIKGRYVFPGHLKLPVKYVEDGTISKKDFELIKDVLTRFKDRLISNCEVDKRSCVSVALDRLHKLYIDYYDNHLSLYLEDLDNDRWTEILSDKLALRIIDKESLILSTHRNQIKFCELTDKQKRDTLVQTAIHSAYNVK